MVLGGFGLPRVLARCAATLSLKAMALTLGVGAMNIRGNCAADFPRLRKLACMVPGSPPAPLGGNGKSIAFGRRAAWIGLAPRERCRGDIGIKFELEPRVVGAEVCRPIQRQRLVAERAAPRRHAVGRHCDDLLNADLRSQFCARCGAPMRLINGRKGKFWGCTKYPECRQTRPFRPIR